MKSDLKLIHNRSMRFFISNSGNFLFSFTGLVKKSLKTVLLNAMDTLLIYVPKKTNRLRYTFKLVFKDLLKFPYKITNDIDEFQSSDLPKFIYSNKRFSDDLFFRSGDMLFQRGINNPELNPFEFEGLKVIFPVSDDQSVLPFDVFSAIFYFTSRYEEYQPHVRDHHGRFTAKLSVSSEYGILGKPVVNIWALRIKKILLGKYPSMKFPVRKYKFIPTYDIDSAFAYAQKGFIRSLGGYFIDFKNTEWDRVGQRTRVIFRREKDPFNTFDLQIDYQKKYKLRPFYFILFGRYGQYDKNINIRNKHFRQLIKRLGDYAQIGIHPSYFTNEHPERLSYEIQNLSRVINMEVNSSRQHFLRVILPQTYRNLIENDITDDYSMGYAALPGFRAGTCSPFHFYDLDMEEETKLRIYPFAVMDGTLRDYMNLSPAEAIDEIKKLVNEVKAVNGTFISLWHNESLSNQQRWTGWQTVYEELLKAASE